MSTDRTIDGILRRYLLGMLDPAVREEIEKRLFSEDQIFWEQMSLAEDELVDAYVGGQLEEDERRRFEERFLVTEERRDKVLFARELTAYAANAEEARPEPRRAILVPWWAAAAAALVVAVLPAVTWQMARSGQTAITSAWLSTGTTRSVGSELDRVRVSLDAALVRLRLEVEPAKRTVYRATMHLVGGDEVWSQNNLSPTQVDDRQAIELTLPAQMLPPGDYFIRLFELSPPNEPFAVGRYDFRVIRSP